MPPAFRFLFGFFVAVGTAAPGAHATEGQVVRVVVLDNAAPMAYRDESGQLTGFSVEIARAVCQDIRALCLFESVPSANLIDILSSGKADIAAAGLLETPERRGRMLFSKPYYRSVSLWVSRPDVEPGRAGVRVAVVQGSAQAGYAQRQGWNLHLVRTSGELAGAVVSGAAEVAFAPMIHALQMQKTEAFRQMGMVPTLVRAPEVGGDAAFGISLKRPDLKEEIDAAVDRIKRNGTYDRINSRFLPFRVN